MTIKRQYSLPNCKLILEGVGDDSLTVGAPRPSLSMVVNVECHIIGHAKPLVGGQDFLINLVKATTDYAQEYLSGIRHPAIHNGKLEGVQIQALEHGMHRLVVHPQALPDQTTAAEPIQIDLQTVQLFDLVEAIDQLCADTQTLPEVSLKLTPLPKRYAVSQEPVSKRVVPAAIGVSGLAIASALLFMIPVPEVRRPEPTQGGLTQESPIASPAGAGSPTPNGSGSPEPLVSSPAAAATPNPEPSASPDASPATSETNASEATAANIFDSAPTITDSAQVGDLGQALRSELDEAWSTRPSFTEDLIYRVGVAENGDIIGFDYENDAALEHRQEVPLLDLLYNPTDTPTNEPIADFRVVFTPQGVVEVSPWHGRVTPESSPTSTP
ncbi:MAG: DUF4335 domain-containing protein [Oculatellaceae cyanobacterium bins.114]|nr:DUF4335 domain-containing protein [Oculatellaceae cyanobacterium bins.114]